MSAKQVWMSIYDINPTESFWDKVDDTKLYKEDARVWMKQELIDDIREHGLKYQLNVDPEGNIKNGNMRYWVARYLLENEDDQRFAFLPVQRNYASGAFYKEFAFHIKKDVTITQEEVDKIGDKIAIDIHSYWVNQTRELTLPHKETFDIYTIDPIDEFRMSNFWAQQRNVWSVFLQPHPKKEKNMVCFGISGKGGKVAIMEEGSEEEKKAYKEWWLKVRQERKNASPEVLAEHADFRKSLHGKSKS